MHRKPKKIHKKDVTIRMNIVTESEEVYFLLSRYLSDPRRSAVRTRHYNRNQSIAMATEKSEGKIPRECK